MITSYWRRDGNSYAIDWLLIGCRSRCVAQSLHGLGKQLASSVLCGIVSVVPVAATTPIPILLTSAEPHSPDTNNHHSSNTIEMTDTEEQARQKEREQTQKFYANARAIKIARQFQAPSATPGLLN